MSIILRGMAQVTDIPPELKHNILSRYAYVGKDGAEIVNYIYKNGVAYLPPNPHKLMIVSTILGQEIIDERSKGLPLDSSFVLQDGFTPRESQVKPISDFTKHLKQFHYGTLVSCCGSGKSIMVTRCVGELGCKVIVLSDQDFSKEWGEAFKVVWGKEIQKLKNDTTEFADCAFATLQLLYQNPELLNRIQNVYGTLVLDEFQIYSNGAETYKFVIYRLNNYYRAGCTATFKSKNFPVEIIADTISSPSVVVEKGSTETMVADVIFVRTGVEYCSNDPYEMTTINADLASNTDRNNLIINLIKRGIKDNRRIIVINNSQEQIDNMYPQLLSLCKPVKYTSKTPKAMANTVPDRFEAGEFNVLLTIKKVRKGKNLPSADMLIFCYPSNDEAMVEQISGRVERCAEGKRTPLIYELVDTKESSLSNVWSKPYPAKTLAEVFAWKHRRWHSSRGCKLFEED